MKQVDLIKLAVMRSVAAWFEMFGAIQTKGGAIIKNPSLRANYLQTRISEAIEHCIDAKLACRLLILKPRQKGCSTFSMASFYRFLSNAVRRGCVIGGAHDQGSNLFKMLSLYASNDDFAGTNKVKVLDREARWASGSRAVQQTARNPEAGRSGTFESVIATEVARWAEEGVANAADVLAGLLKCVPELPGTLVILESTAAGASGDFFDRWQRGITIEEAKAGKSGFIKIFAPWFVFEDSRRDPKSEGIESVEDLSAHEKEMGSRWHLDLWQVAWMRWAIREECKGDFDVFCQDYPFDDESAFLRSGRRRFNMGCVARMKEGSGVHPIIWGDLVEAGDNVIWKSVDAAESRILRWEERREGCKYLVSVDPMTGGSQVSGKDPDNHGVTVWRAGYFENGRGWVRPKLVGQLIGDWQEWEKNRKYVLRWDVDVLEEMVWRCSEYWGRCMVVVEENMDRGLIQMLSMRGVNLYSEEVFNRREYTVSNRVGWKTTAQSRERAIEGLAKVVRDMDVEIWSPMLLQEMENFVVKENGRSEAMGGKHDDLVMSAALGVATLGGATEYKGEYRRMREPADLVRLERGRKKLGSRQYG